MQFRVDAKYVWFNKGSMLVLMYFMNNVPFSFDIVSKLDDWDIDPVTIDLADKEKRYEQCDVYQGSSYLISEMCHPCFHEVEIENPEILPDDICGTQHDIIDYF